MVYSKKAMGSWLRVLGSHQPGRVIQFLKAHWQQLKYVAKKNATRK
jgi:ATP:corrinoid adenosyltransferase